MTKPKGPVPDEGEWITAREAAAFLGCSRQTVWNLTRSGVLEHRTGTWRTISRASLLKMLGERGRPDELPADGPDEWIGSADAAERLEMSTQRVRELARAGVLEGRRTARGYRFLLDDVEDLARRRREAQGGGRHRTAGRDAGVVAPSYQVT